MSIRMPTYDELSEEQLAILEDTDLDSNLLVVGPPGTGKTVIAMWRAKQVCGGGSGEQATLIMYNVVLASYSSQWDDQDSSVDVSTYHKWTYRFWRRNFGSNPPSLPEDKYRRDWPQMVHTLLKSRKGVGHLIVDEAQDLPPEFFTAMGVVTAKDLDSTICVVADENQALKMQNSAIREIREPLSALGVLPESLLTRNYRNTKEIAALASCFYVGHPSGIAAPPLGSGPKPHMAAYSGLDAMVKAIGTYSRNNPGHSLLVITDRSLKRCFNKIEQNLRGTGIKVEGYKNHKDKKKSYLHGDTKLNTGDPGTVTCVHWQSMKGLEADAVFVPEFEKHNMGNDGMRLEKMRMYVLFSRARQYIEVQYEKATSHQDRMLTLMRDEAGDTLEWRSS